MLGTVSKYIQYVSVLRRLLFAVVYLPSDSPNLWGVAVEFATRDQESRDSITDAQAKVWWKTSKSLMHLPSLQIESY